ncbi:MAG: hypothetical protein DRN25_02500 [Thermoplasmata archaeon]|nr:MAG: hypothetical protein DRN25_02500 [Thermoplasmata archaeon]
MIVDSHVHLGGPDIGDGASLSVEELLKEMDEVGVDKAIVFPFNENLERANYFISRMQRENPDKLIGFARLDPNMRELSLLNARRALTELGLKGIKLHPTAQNFYPNHPFVFKILEIAEEVGVPVVFDNGKEASKNTEIAKLAEKVPGVTIILAHMRGENYIEVCEEHDNVYLGTVKAEVDRVVEALDRLGANKLIAGSDFPYASMKYEIREKFEEIVSERERELILGKNISEILKL